METSPSETKLATFRVDLPGIGNKHDFSLEMMNWSNAEPISGRKRTESLLKWKIDSKSMNTFSSWGMMQKWSWVNSHSIDRWKKSFPSSLRISKDKWCWTTAVPQEALAVKYYGYLGINHKARRRELGRKNWHFDDPVWAVRLEKTIADIHFLVPSHRTIHPDESRDEATYWNGEGECYESRGIGWEGYFTSEPERRWENQSSTIEFVEWVGETSIDIELRSSKERSRTF